jgi:predicted SAM-dependent methyltransferase
MRKFSFSGLRSGFDSMPQSASVDCSWYTNFLTEKADVFLLEHGLQYLNEHAALDFLIFCRNSLNVNGRIRIAETDWNHPKPGYINHARAFKPPLRFTIDSLGDLLWRVGLACDPIEFWDDGGEFHMAAKPYTAEFGLISRSQAFDRRAKDPDILFSSLIVDAIKISDSRRSNGQIEKIHVIGDRHVRLLAGKDEISGAVHNVCRIFDGFSAKFTSYHIGPGLAFSLNKRGTKTLALEQIEQVLKKKIIPTGSQPMFSFGEIDCRFHVCRQAERQGESIRKIVADICVVYIEFLDEIALQGYRVSVWAPFATTWLDRWDDPDHPVYGTYEARSEAVRQFNEVMSDYCRIRGYGFFSVFGKVQLPDGSVDRSFFYDPLHLSQKARRFVHAFFPEGGCLEP